MKDGQNEGKGERVWRVWCQTTFQRLSESLRRLSLHHCGSHSACYHGNKGLHGGPELEGVDRETEGKKIVSSCSQVSRGLLRPNILAQGDKHFSTPSFHLPLAVLVSGEVIRSPLNAKNLWANSLQQLHDWNVLQLQCRNVRGLSLLCARARRMNKSFVNVPVGTS